MKKIILLLLISTAYFVQQVSAQSSLEIYPSNWWVGMKNKQLQLMLHQKNIGKASAVTINYPGVHLKQSHQVESANYLFLDLVIDANTRPGKVKIAITENNNHYSLAYELKQRREGNGKVFAQGVHSEDFIYLIMPDRFSNGDTTNDHIVGMKDQSLNRDSIYLRHGGDFQGIVNHLDYLKNLGVTTLWMTPVLENDMPNRTEHGYAFTNHYTIEPRLGGATGYKLISDELHKRGMKLIQDAVYNHVGLYNFTVQDPPMKDWLHQWPSFTQPNYKDQTLFDPYVAQTDKKKMVDGWFTKEMPDLNQGNPYVANFLIQHAIWSVEEFGVDGWRIDTYIYLDQQFMNRCNQALLDEYPNITMFGEAWVHGTANQAYFTRNNYNVPFKSNLTGVCDFQLLFDGIQPALQHAPDGVNSLYQVKSNDFLYKNPLNNVIFLDNHDMTRSFSQYNEDIAKQKMGMAWLLTERGIPEMYYGTEVLMKGISNPDGWVRLDFPGGWSGDKKNAFNQQGLSAEEKDFQAYTAKLANFRRNTAAIKTGKMTQYVPDNGLYVYFRYNLNQTIMCVMNTSDIERLVDFTNYAERTAGFSKATDVVTGKPLSTSFSIPAKTFWVLELNK